MNNSKVISSMLLAGTFIGILVMYNFAESSPSIDDELHSKNSQKTPKIAVINQRIDNIKNIEQSIAAPAPAHKKVLTDEWCNAREELTLDDFDYVTSEYKDWQVYIGKARIKDESDIHTETDEFEFPNNEYVAPYQELSLDELEERAFEGDKWAMIAFLQKATFNQRDKQVEISNRLLVQGASYYAIKFLVRNELVHAKTAYRRNQPAEIKKHMVNVVVYTMLGLREYNESGLSVYLANITRDKLFLGPLAPSLVLAKSSEDIRTRYSELDAVINKTREELGITMPQPTKGAKRLFDHHMAIIQYRKEDAVRFLDSMQITPEVDLVQTPCMKSHLANLAEKMRQSRAY